MKGTEHFKQAIKSYLDGRAKTDELFAVAYAKENKNLDDIALVGLSDYGCRTVAFPRGQQPAMLAVILKFFSVVVIVHISVFI